MPIHIHGYERHEWRTGPGDLPIGETLTLAGRTYVKTCPLCGCLHELDTPGGIVKPRCLLIELAGQGRKPGQRTGWRELYERWCSLFPDAPQYTLIYAMTPEQLSMLPAAPRKRGRGKAKAA